MFRKYLLLCLLLFGLFLYSVPVGGFLGDVGFFVRWAAFIKVNGIGRIYECDADYLPLYYYILWFFGKLQSSPDKIAEYAHYLKLISFLFHLVSGYLLVLFLREKGMHEDGALLRGVFYLLNIAVLYNTLVWSQTDDILACFAMLSVYAAWRRRIVAALCFLVLMLNFKLQGIVFVPLVALLLLPSMLERWSAANAVKWVCVPLVVQGLILWPFIQAGALNAVWENVLKSGARYPVVSMSAYNVWIFLAPDNQQGTLDNTAFFGMTYRAWGFSLFVIASFVVLLPSLRHALSALKRRKEFAFDPDKMLIAAALLPLCFFYFNTQMHERYSHPAFIFLWTYAFRSGNYLPALVGSSAYLLNMERVLHALPFQNYGVALFSGYLISTLYLITMVLLVYRLYQRKEVPSGELLAAA